MPHCLLERMEYGALPLQLIHWPSQLFSFFSGKSKNNLERKEKDERTEIKS